MFCHDLGDGGGSDDFGSGIIGAGCGGDESGDFPDASDSAGELFFGGSY